MNSADQQIEIDSVWVTVCGFERPYTVGPDVLYRSKDEAQAMVDQMNAQDFPWGERPEKDQPYRAMPLGEYFDRLLRASSIDRLRE